MFEQKYLICVQNLKESVGNLFFYDYSINTNNLNLREGGNFTFSELEILGVTY
jgi:hypothetical protein